MNLKSPRFKSTLLKSLFGFCLFLLWLITNTSSPENRLLKSFEKNKSNLTETTTIQISQIIDWFEPEKLSQHAEVVLTDTERIVLDEIEKNKKSEEKFINMIPKTGGTPLRILELSSWRSGSTFLGEILQHIFVNLNFFIYEPFMYKNPFQEITEPSSVLESLEVFKQIFNCSFHKIASENMFIEQDIFKRNNKLWDVIWPKGLPQSVQDFKWQHIKTANKKAKSFNDKLKSDPWSMMMWKNLNIPEKQIYISKFCSLFPVQIFKVLRLRVKQLLKLVQDNSTNIHLVYLVRDPRATMNSRGKVKWCQQDQSCTNETYLCSRLREDFFYIKYLKKLIPEKIHVVKFENLALDPIETTKKLLSIFNYTLSDEFSKYIKSHTRNGKFQNLPWSTIRNSSMVPNHWMSSMPTEKRKLIEANCKEALELWGYDNESRKLS